MDDEFKSFGNEMNKPISEFKNIEAMEYYPVNEAVATPVEYVAVNEDSSSTEGTNGEPQSALERFNEAQENMDRLNQARNTADGVKSPDMNLANAGEAEAEAAATEASAASSVTVTSTVASLAGSVSVIAAAAVVVATVAGGVLEKEPNVNLIDFESGTNYLKYEIDVTELSENMDYKIRVSNPNFSVEYPILEEGLQCQIVPDLKPFRRYSLEVIGNSAELGDFVYFSKNIYTNELPKPKAVFKFTPHFDYIYGRIDLEYETFISDFYNSGSNVYLQIYSGSRLLVEDHDLPEDNFFRGTIYNLPSISKISAIAFADYFNGLETELEETIGTYGYELELPDDFELKNLFKGTYTFGDECFSQNFDFETGINTLSIDTQFQSDDTDEAYRIDVFNNDELYKSITSNQRYASLQLDAYLRNVDLKFTPIRKNGDSITEYDPVIIEQYDVDPKLFKNVAFSLYENSYYFEAELEDSIAEKVEDKPFTFKMFKTAKGGNKEEFETDLMVVDRAYLSMENLLSQDETITIADFESFDVELICDGKILSKFYAQAQPKLTLGQADVDDDGNVIIPYEIELDDKYKNVEIHPFIGGLEAREPLTEKKGNIVLEEISGNIISGSIDVSYTVNGTRISNSIYIDEINLGVDYEVSYFISHNGSYYETLNIKFDTTINGKNANINLYPMADRGDDFVAFDDISNEKYLGYYRISNYSDTFSYKIGAYGFDDTVYTIENINNDIGDEYSNTRVAELNSYTAGNYDNVNSIYYVNYYKDKNSDGTVNYYVNSNLSGTSNHYARIEGKYIDSNGIERYYFSPFTQDANITLLNLPDFDYEFVYRVYYKYGDIFYDTEFAYNKYYYELKSGEDLLIDSRTFIGKLENNQTGTVDSVVNFELYTEGLSTDPITLTYNKKDYEINWDISSDLLSSWAETEYNGTQDAISNEFRMDGYTYSLMFYNKVNGVYKNLAVEFYIEDDEEPLDTNTKIKYKSSGTIMSKEFSTEREENLVEYEGKYDIDSIYYTYDTSGDSNVIYVYVPGANLKNRSMLRLEAYYNGELITSDNINSSGYTYFYIGSGYTDIDFYLVEVIQQNNDSFKHNNTNDSNYLEFNRYKIESPTLPAQNIVLDNINLSYDSENNEYTVSGTASDFSDYEVQVKVHYNNEGEKFTYEYTSEMGINNISFINEGNIESIDVLVLRYGSTCVQSNTINTSIDISDVDIDETVLVPYYVPIPKDATLKKLEVSVNGLVHEFSDTDGVIEIEELETNIVDFSFDVTYVDKNGTTVNYVLDMTKELEVTFDYDYSISTYHDSSYGYTEDISISYDATDLNYYMYFAKIKVIPKVGSIVLSNYTDYIVTFLKGGDSYYASPAEIEEREVSGTRFVNGYNAIMYHDIETSTSGATLLAIKGCSLEFSIAGGEKQTINFTPPSNLNSVKSYFGTQLDITNSASWISKHDGVMDVSIDTGFDVSEHPDYAYFATITDSDYNSRETEITTSGIVTFEGLNPNEDYTLMLYICYKDGDGYVTYKHNYYEMKNINKVLDSYNTINEYGYTDPEKYGSFNIYSYMIDTENDITIVVDEGLATEQTKVLSESDLVDGTIALENGISIVIQDNTEDSNYYSIFINAETVDTDLTTAKITLTDVFGEVKTFNI